MLNFGALIAFMGVNAAAFLRYFVRAPREKVLEPDSARWSASSSVSRCGSA